MARRYRPTPEAAPEVLVEAGAAYEALEGLAMIAGDEDESSYLVGRDWFEQTRAHMSPALRTALRRLTGGHGALITHLAGLVHDAPEPRDVTSLLRHIEAIGPQELLLTYLGYHWQSHRGGTPREVIRRAAE